MNTLLTLSVNLMLIWKSMVEIIILWFVIYHIMLFFEGTHAVQVMRGIVILLVCFLVFEKLDLRVLNWLLTKLFGISVIAILIIFHQEIRQGLARLGQRNLFATTLREEELDRALREIGKAIEALSKDKIGALIAIEKDVPLAAYIESGVLIDARLSSDLIQNIFTPNSLLHDGGLIIQNDRIIAAGCLFPLTQKQDLSRVFGTRHRAALGISEETDAIIIIVSEERQDVSLVYRGKLYKDLGPEELFFEIKKIVTRKKEDA